MLTEGTPRAEYGPRAPPPHDFGTAGDEAGGEEEEDVEPAPAPAPAKGKDKKIKKQDIKKLDPKKPASTGKRPVNQVPKGPEPPAEPKGKDAEEEEAGPSQGRPKRVPRAK